MFLKLGDIRGDSTHPSYMGWIRLSELRDWGVRGINVVEIVTWSNKMRGALLKALKKGTNIPIANVFNTVLRVFSSYEGVKLIGVADIKDRLSPSDPPSTVRLRVRFSYKEGRIWRDENPDFHNERSGPHNVR